MTIRELIEELQKYPDDMVVQVYATYDYGYGLAGGPIRNIKKDDVEYAVNLENDDD